MCKYCDSPATLSNSLTSRLSFPGNGEEELLLYPADYLEAVCSSGGEAALSLNTADDPTLDDDDSSSKESLSFQHQSLLLPKDLTIPLDLELRESGAPGRRLGIWSCRRINIGECFGPYKGARWTVRQSPTRDLEVGTQQTGSFKVSDWFAEKGHFRQYGDEKIKHWMSKFNMKI